MLNTLLPFKCSIILLQMKTISTSMFLNNRSVMTEIAYIYAAEFKCNSTCERKRKVTKNRKVRDSAEVKGNFFRRKLAHTISPRSKHIFPIYTCIRGRPLINGRTSITCPRERRALMILIKPISGLLECQSWPSTVSQAGPEKCIKAEWFPYIDGTSTSCGMRAECETWGGA